ncbi:ribulose-phosphate 3-epimerase [Clostridium sp. D2Q-11]|uniref:Ribulose-phosphate 3-epimerase n=1 Tax=Anaeromonas frigoriresistens TaxID=2683708 RepID=A0A942UW89_9FIRM|nr:ribulose-phosphate 3-epimerase [Anaeromonas frigoriresistens]MBS4539743.1 ribulose-phosphate 3-epimerase [Anaeromonas frigoriresistens]
MYKISPSILSADFSDLKSEINKIVEGGADYIHLDVMDGLFVPNITFGAPVIKNLRKITNKPFDVHLMIERPERYIDDFVDAGADIITVHQESSVHLHRTIQQIKNHGIKAGVSLNPATPIETIEYVLENLDMVLIMTVNPGFGGQSLIKEMKEKVMKLRSIIEEKNLDIDIQVDGGVKLDNIEEIKSWGANIFVVGSGIFKAKDIKSETQKYKEILF